MLVCPCCRHKVYSDATTGFDYYAISLGLSRQLTHHFLITMPRTLSNAPAIAYSADHPQLHTNCTPINPKKNTYANTSNDELAELSMKRLPQYLVHGSTKLSAHCHKCGSSFVFEVTSPDAPTNSQSHPTISTVSRPLSYCPYCATATLIITPINQPFDNWSYLASLYNVPVISIKAYYKVWSQSFTKAYPQFSEFMKSMPQRLSAELAALPKAPTKKRKIIVKRRPAATSALMPQAPVYTTPSSIPQAPTNNYRKCITCNECELPPYTHDGKVNFQTRCEQCTITYLTRRTNFNSQGGC